jgi:hypothetical protein
MSKEKPSYIWHAQQTPPECDVIHCKSYDPYADFKRDPSGFYILIKVNFSTLAIEVAMCDKDHNIRKIFVGKKCQDLYDTILSYEKKHKLKWFEDKTHIAYLGKELKKAELALVLGNNAYFQE